ncbi:MAG: T9SS type A sorting domain-containing protein [Bacteroidetes bacterium]|nr:T9SS type A sorting domain-containing protein [Bacteroidota bacterium]
MTRKITTVSAAFLFGAFTLSAQDDSYLHCGTDQQMAKVFAEHPELKSDFDRSQQDAENHDRSEFQNGYPEAHLATTLYIIPIVFHIIHMYGSENISDAQVIDEVNILNRDYRKLNADTAAIVNGFGAIASDVNVEFRLANIDPNGNCTNGIDRVYSSLTNNADDNSKLNDWPRNKYLNVWVVKSIGTTGVAGYAYLPGTAPSSSTDGVLILSSYIGSIGTGNTSTSRALTHEIGHFLNLQHVWGNTNNPGVACGNDGVTDTPVTKGYTSCPLTNNEICNATIHENVQNYMEYSYCSVMFTAGQVSRMRSALTSGTGQRNSLWTAANMVATGALNSPQNVCTPKADFLPYNTTMVCAGGSITFTDISWNGHPTGWLWSFPGGTPSTSTDSIPIVQYNTPGVYSVTLTATNATGSNTVTRTNLIYVSSTTAQYNQWNYFEGWETSSTFTNDWVVINPTGSGWTRVTTAAYNGSASAKLSNSASSAGSVDELVSPSVDFSAITGGPSLTFRLAFAQRTSTDLDKLRILVSTNCGQTWSQRYLKSGTTLSTVSPTGVSFTPTSSAQWRLVTVSVSNVATNSDVRIKFEFTSDGGNNIYIDDINIQGTTGIFSPEAGIENFAIYPNPAGDNTNISFGAEKTMNASITIMDVTGRIVKNVYDGQLASGEHQFPVSTAELDAGIYFVQLTTSEGKSITQKMIVN